MRTKIDSFQGEFRWLSNFWPCSVMLDGMTFPSTEHAYQAAKTLTLGERKKFQVGTAGQAKRLGRKVKIRSDWESVKLDVMLNLLRQKFSSGELRSKLIATGNTELIEGNTWGDRFWGVCDGRGENHLGKLLMKVRAEQKAEK